VSVRAPTRMKELGSHWTDFFKSDIGVFLEKCVGKIQVLLSVTSIKSTTHEGKYVHFLKSYFAHFFLKLKMLRAKIIERIKTLIFFQYFPSPKIVFFIKVMWKNVIEPDSPQVKT
jgi:hypothetical protein